MKNILNALSLVLFFSLSADLNAQFDVVWTDLVGVSASGNTITKTATTGWGNGGAASENILVTGVDGWIEVEAQQTNTNRMFGLSMTNTNASYNNIDYAIQLNAAGKIKIWENGTKKVNDAGIYVIGDLLKIERIGNTITYLKNNSTFYTSSIPSSSQLICDAALDDSGSTISNAKASFSVPPSGTTDWQLSGSDIFYDAGHVAVNTATTTKAFSIYNSGTGNTEFQVNGDGKVYAREVEVTLNAFPDYVFKEDYPLMPLKQLKKYIDTNGHLPNIPSAEVVDNDGIGLGDLSHKQMEKIEELTLYILQLDERIQKLEKKNNIELNSPKSPSTNSINQKVKIGTTSSTSKVSSNISSHNTKTSNSNALEAFNFPPVTDWQLNGSDIFYDAGAVSVNTSSTSKAFSIVENGTTQFQINGDGKAYAREVEVTLNAFPDYVFEKEYPLMSLGQLKKYIEENKHLPNIPSAEVIDNKGIGLGDLSIKKMEKIEELTLYLLQLDERMEKLKK
jgi:hypothetical protein